PRREVFHGIERYIDFKVALDQGPIGRSAKSAKLSDLRTRKTERNCHASSNPRLHRAPATDSRRPADPTSRMGRATWRILHALKELLDTFTRRESNESVAAIYRALEQGTGR